MKTFRSIINDLEEFTNNHYQINSFLFGNNEVITTEDNLFPMLYIEPTNSSMKNGSAEYTFNLRVLDILEQDDSNNLDISNETLLIARDFIAEFFEDNPSDVQGTNTGIDFELLTDNINGNYEHGVYDDLLAGWRYSITIETKLPLSSCITPNQPEPLRATATVIIPARPEYPFDFPISISAAGGVAPYTRTGQVRGEWETGDTITMGITAPAEGEVVDEGTYFTLETIVPNSSGDNFPRYAIYCLDLPTEINKTYRLSFDYERLSGDEQPIMYYNIGYWINNSSLRMPGDSGSVVDYFTTDEVPGVGDDLRVTIRLNNISAAKYKFTDFKLTYIDDETSGVDIDDEDYGTWGSYEYTVTDSVGDTVETAVDLLVPTPNHDLSIKPIESGNLYYLDNNTKLYVYGKGENNNYYYINWGDGSDISYGTESTPNYHNYTDPTQRYNIDIYGDGLDGIYGGYNSGVPIEVSVDYLNGLGRDLDRLQLYSGRLDGALERLEYRVRIWYSYYGVNHKGDIAGIASAQQIYNIALPYSNDPARSDFTPGIYGDIGTWFNGNFDGVKSIKYTYIYRNALFTYQNRITHPIQVSGYIRIYGLNTSEYTWVIRTPNEVAQLIVDLDTWVTNPSGFQIYLPFNASPDNADEPLLSEFIAAKANWIANGGTVVHD